MLFIPRIILLMKMIISRTKVAATPATWSTLATTTSTSWPPFPLGIFQAKVELVINISVFIPGFSFSWFGQSQYTKFKPLDGIHQLILHQKGSRSSKEKREWRKEMRYPSKRLTKETSYKEELTPYSDSLLPTVFHFLLYKLALGVTYNSSRNHNYIAAFHCCELLS